MVEEPMTIRVDWFLDGTRNMAELKEWNVNLFWICFYTELPKKPKYTSIYCGRFDKSGLRSLRAYSYIEILGCPFRALLQTCNTQKSARKLIYCLRHKHTCFEMYLKSEFHEHNSLHCV